MQHGTQSRSSRAAGHESPSWPVASGKYGKLLVSRGLLLQAARQHRLQEARTAAPPELDFNLWLGPAPEQPYHENLVHYNWHWFWDFGNGDIGNQGVHQMDIARWMIPGATLPEDVFSLGGRFGYEDQGQTPNTQVSVMDFGEGQPLLVFEVRGLKTDAYQGEKVGNILHFEEGVVAGGRFHPKDRGDGEGEALPADLKGERGPGGSNHFANFIAAVRSRSSTDLNADIQEGHYSSALCHLANVSYRLGQPAAFTSASTAFDDCAASCETFDRMRRHLADENGISLQGLEYTMGRKLELNPQNERFVNDVRANTMLTRRYRQGFVVPEKIS